MEKEEKMKLNATILAGMLSNPNLDLDDQKTVDNAISESISYTAIIIGNYD
jgi:hypothetical protein